MLADIAGVTETQPLISGYKGGLRKVSITNHSRTRGKFSFSLFTAQHPEANVLGINKKKMNPDDFISMVEFNIGFYRTRMQII